MLNFLLPFHPKIVHFPIALVTVALLFTITGQLTKKEIFWQAALLMFLFAAFFLPCVVFSGLMEEDRLHLHHPVLTAHKNFAFLTTGVALISIPILWFLRKGSQKVFNCFFLALLLFLTITVTITAHYGGKMVYGYGVGVNP